MSAQESATISPEYSNTARRIADRLSKLAAALTRMAVRPGAWVAFFTCVGLLARLYSLDARGLWFDEVTYAWAVRLNNPGDLIFLAHQFGDPSPLSFFLTWLVRGLGGSEWVVRLPFAIAGTLCIPAIYLLGRELARSLVGLVAALLFALSAFGVFYSQDAHPYSPLLLFTTLQLFFAYRSAIYGCRHDWLGFSIASILNLYNDFLGLIISAVACLFIALVLAGRIAVIARNSDRQPSNASGSAKWRDIAAQSGFALASLVAISLSYLPWLPSAQFFLSSPFLGFNRLPPGQHGSFADLLGLLRELGFNEFFDILLLIGLGYTLVTFVRGRRPSSLLLLVWLTLPLAGFWLRAGDAMVLLLAQYYSFLFPLALVLIAIGIECLVHSMRSITSFIVRRFALRGSRMAFPLIYGIVLAVVLAQTSAALAASYSWPQITPQDYRGAVDRIIAGSPPGSMVVELGMWGIKPAPSYIVDGIDYYFWLRHSPIKPVDGSLLDERSIADVANDAVIWGVVTLPWPLTAEQTRRAADLGLEVTQLQNVDLLRQRAPRGTPAEQMDILLNWGSAMQPGLVATRAMLNPDFRAAALGENLLPPTGDAQVPAHPGNPLNGEPQQDRWALWPGSSLSRANSFVMHTNEVQPAAGVTLSTRKLLPGMTYILTFHYRNVDFKGNQRVYISTYSASGRLIDTYPYDEGFLCPPKSDSESAFAFPMPPLGSSVILKLQTEGTGTAEFSSIQLQPLR